MYLRWVWEAGDSPQLLWKFDVQKGVHERVGNVVDDKSNVKKSNQKSGVRGQRIPKPVVETLKDEYDDLRRETDNKNDRYQHEH